MENGWDFIVRMTGRNVLSWNGLKRAFTRFGKWCRKIIDPEPDPTENELLEVLPGFRELFAADLC